MMAKMETPTVSELQELHQAARTASLEQAYQRSLHDYDSIIAEEDARRLRLRILLLEDGNDDLHAQLAEEDERADALEREAQELQDRLVDSEEECQRALANLRVQARDVDTLKAELNAMRDVSANATKLLTEKLALQHELANIKPEIDHLRSQLSSHQAVVAEKLSLQRQLDTVRVELETEKRATQRVLAKEKKDAAQDGKSEEQLNAMRADLAKENREREKLDRETRKQMTEMENKWSVAESKLDAMRTKLRSTKDQLKESQAQLQQAQDGAAKAATQPSAAANGDRAAKNPRKRNAAHLDSYASIGTPDGAALRGGPAAKRGQRASSAVPGEKSIFSITPFLNRTSLAPDSTEHEQDEDDEEEVEVSVAMPTTEEAAAEAEAEEVAVVKTRTKGARNAAQPRAKPSDIAVLGNAKTTKGNAKPPGTRKRATASTLENVEEGNEENEAPVPPAVKTTSQVALKPAAVVNSFVDEPGGKKKKKRKLLGAGGAVKTLFDDEDAESAKPAKSIFGGPRGFPSWVKGGLGAPKAGMKGGVAAGGAAGFGAFSPLKKDRRAGAADTTVQ